MARFFSVFVFFGTFKQTPSPKPSTFTSMEAKMSPHTAATQTNTEIHQREWRYRLMFISHFNGWNQFISISLNSRAAEREHLSVANISFQSAGQKKTVQHFEAFLNADLIWALLLFQSFVSLSWFDGRMYSMWFRSDFKSNTELFSPSQISIQWNLQMGAVERKREPL